MDSGVEVAAAGLDVVVVPLGGLKKMIRLILASLSTEIFSYGLFCFSNFNKNAKLL